jgi:malonate transporter
VIDILTGFAVIALAVFVGWLAGRTGVLGPNARPVLARLNFSVLSPFLLFSVLATADVRALFSALLPVSAIAAVSVMIVFSVISLLLLRRDVARTSVRGILRSTFTNPIIIGSLLGVLVSVSGLELPAILLDPIQLIGQAAVPLMLIAYGLSLHGSRMFEPGTGLRDVVTAATLKLFAMPAIAWALGAFVFGLEGRELYAVTVLAALPTAQNVFTVAVRYNTGVILARDAIFLSTILAVPALVVIAALLA